MIKHITLLSFILVFAVRLEAIVTRHDVSKEQYIAKLHPDYLINMPDDGHGVLIDAHWIVTVGHLIFDDYRGMTLKVGKHHYEIERVILHPNYSKPPKGIFSGHSAPSQEYLKANHDVALIKLTEPVIDVVPIKLYPYRDELGKVITLLGKGNTGNGLTGQKLNTKGTLRQAQNVISTVQEQWLIYNFDEGENALLLEGIQGDGDSGGPVIIEYDGVEYLAGLASWDVYEGNIEDFQGGLYGMSAAVVRMSYYSAWIDEVSDRSP